MKLYTVVVETDLTADHNARGVVDITFRVLAVDETMAEVKARNMLVLLWTGKHEKPDLSTWTFTVSPR